MLDTSRWLAVCLAACSLASPAVAQEPRSLERPPGVPDALAAWLPWVRAEQAEFECPVRDGRALCFWPGPLSLDLEPSAGSFRFELLLDRKSAVRLPGGVGRWPLSVRVDGKPAPVVARADVPTLELAAGSHRIEGRFAWSRLPESLPVPAEYGQLALQVAGQAVARPKRDESGSLWLRTAGDEGEQAQLELIVHRKLQDAVPLRIETRIRLRAAGEPREVNLGKVLLAGTRALSVDSQLPVRLDPSGELRAQLRAGSYELRVSARAVGDPLALASEPRPAPWPVQEVWVFVPDEALRQVRVSGAPAVDPARFDLDADLRNLPAFLVSPTDRLTLAVQRRGEPEPPPNQLSLERQLWLDQDGRGYSVRDRLSGELHRGFRLELSEGALGRVAQAGQDQLVTQRKPDGPSGVELRDVQLALEADSRLADARGSLPAVGWSEDVRSLGITLHMPPGFTLWAVKGADSVDRSWLGDWELFGLFFVLVIAFGTGSVAGAFAGALALFTLGLTYHEPDAPSAVWLVLLAVAALTRFVRSGGFARVLRFALVASLFWLALELVPFAARSLREAMYPQLASQDRSLGYRMNSLGYGRDVPTDDYDEQEAARGAAEPTSAPSAPLSIGQAEVAQDAVLPQAPALPAPNRKSAGKIDADAYLGSVTKARRPAQDPDAVVQTGPGLPDWQFQSWRLTWSGPVAHDHRFDLLILGPLANRGLSVLRVILCALLAYFIVRAARAFGPPGGQAQPRAQAKDGGDPEPRMSDPTREADSSGATEPERGPLRALIGVALAGALSAGEARAQFPDPQLLDQLRERALRPPACRPQCASVNALDVRVGPQGLALRAELHAQDHTSLRVPGPLSLWAPERVQLDGTDARMVALEDGFLHVRVSPGVHTLEVQGALPTSDTLNLRFGDAPARVSVVSAGYEVRGVRADGSAEDSIEIRRILRESSEASSVTLPPWFRLTRTLELGSEFRIQTLIERETPSGNPALVRLPLLPSESVQDARVQLEAGAALVTFGPDDTRFAFESSLFPSAALELVAAKDASYSERWQLRCGTMWQCAFEGLAPVRHEADGQWQPLFRPWPGERLRISAHKPAAAPGQSTTIDAAKLTVRPGVRATDVDLQLSLRTSRGGIQRLTLPERAVVRSFSVRGERRPLQRDGSAHTFSVLPGAAQVSLRFELGSGASDVLKVPQVELGTAVKNARVVVELPPDRWLLWLHGPSWGPAILFWGYLGLAVLIALILGRASRSAHLARAVPLGTWQWLLLGLGLTQVGAFEALTVVGFFFALAWRAQSRELRWWKHDLVQLALLFWAMVFMSALFYAVRQGLLVQPDMQVAGAGSHQGSLQWYVDDAGTSLPTPTVFSVPLWIYRVLMLVWSLWLARQLVRWAPWAFRAWSSGAVWKRRPSRSGPTAPQP